VTAAPDIETLVAPTRDLVRPRLLLRSGPTPLPAREPEEFLGSVEAAGLTGRGGAAFPTWRKLASVRGGPAPRVVIANGAEGEPASNKDKALLATNPHLVLDGLQVAARIVGADSAYLYVHNEPALISSLVRTLAERAHAGVDALAPQLVIAPPRFVAGEESAVAARISGDEALPRSKPPRVFESGAFGRPTLVQNVETLAHVGYIARRGAEDFRTVGVDDQPGTMLFTLSGAVRRPGVIEAPVGVVLADLVAAAGGLSSPPQAVLLGGYHGSWVRWPAAATLMMANSALRPHGLSVGAGVVVLFPADGCGPAEVSRVLDYLADESAGQCGPCIFGLPALAKTYGELVAGRRSGRRLDRIHDLSPMLERRGGCAHPDGTLRFTHSALTVFADHLALHHQHGCAVQHRSQVLPIPTG
jgi:NADH:ubiquinone oxidoreductase subunit F (NADH-binding)